MANPIARRTLTALTTAAAAACAILYAPTWCIRPACAALAALAGLELALLLRRKAREECVKSFCAAALFAALLATAFTTLPSVAERFGNATLLYVVAIVKVSDMGGFAFGLGSLKLFGRNRRLCPSVSPNKSWEGLFGSVFAACAVSCAFMPVTGFAAPKALAFGAVASLAGTAGDLAESKLKRWVGVKDSATFMPAGLGGLLDMFDSLLFAPALLLPFV